jgi:molybdate/tungstate transport system substrate-binding protein
MYIRAYRRYVQPNITGDQMVRIELSNSGLTKIQVAVIISVLAIATIGGILYYGTTSSQKTVLKVFCAGSLTLPFEDIKAQFEADHTNVEVQLEPGGSVTRVQKITELGEECDVLASADYTLIPSMMMTPDSHYTDWYIIFAVNRMTIAYTDNSRYADEINSTNWYQILRRSDVKWGFSNPNMDPCGYRSPMVIQLAESEYGDDTIFEDLIEANSDITVSEADGIYTIDANMTDLNPNTDRLMIREKSVDLVTFVQEGGLDYAFEYSSVAKQYGLKFLELPESIDLSSDNYKDVYKTVKVRKTTTTSTGKPIVYGLTIPNNAPNPSLAEDFVKYIINEFGQSVLLDNAQPPVVPAITNDIIRIPEILKTYVVEQ